MELQQRIDFERANGVVTAILTLTTPSGASQRYVATVDDDDVQAFVGTIALADGAEVSGAHEVGVKAPGAAAWWWKAAAANGDKKPVTDEQARAAWWNRIGADKREWCRAMFRGVQAWGLEGDPAAGHAQLLKVGKEGRERILHRYKRGIWDAGRATKKGLDIAAKVAPIALAVIPGVGPVVAGVAMLAITAAKKIAAGKVQDVAAMAIEQAAKASGKEVPPAVKEMVAKLGATAKLTAASVAADAGATKAATQIAKRAQAQVAKALPGKAPAILRASNEKRKAVVAIAERRPPGASAPPRQTPPKPPSGDVLARARAGTVRSTSGSPATPAELLAAQRAGRVFFVYEQRAS